MTNSAMIPPRRLLSHSGKSGAVALTLILVATCLIAALVALDLLGQRPSGVGGAPAGTDDNGVWIIGL